jgi:hypothetical protein
MYVFVSADFVICHYAAKSAWNEMLPSLLEFIYVYIYGRCLPDVGFSCLQALMKLNGWS